MAMHLHLNGRRHTRLLVACSTLTCGVAALCCATSGTPDGSGFGSLSSSGVGAGTTGRGQSSSTVSVALGGDAGFGGSSLVSTIVDAATCASETRKGQVIPVDIFIMIDQSGSMTDKVTGPNGTTAVKWDLLIQALTAFVNDPRSAGLGAGVGYFPIPPIDNSSCDAGTYSVPDVPIAILPGNAAPIVASLKAHNPGGQTPTVPSLVGALEYAKAWATQNPTHKVVVAYATDGAPHGCTNNTVAAAAVVAQAAANGTPPIATYVIGIGGNLTSLGAIAEAGSTGSAIIVDTSQDTAQQLLSAMNTIRAAAAVPCSLTIPSGDGGPVDFGNVNIIESPSDGGSSVGLFQVPDAASCDPVAGGWYYDNPAAPTEIELCSASCSSVTLDLTAAVNVLLGCKTQTLTPR
jgi:hypothetical protein